MAYKKGRDNPVPSVKMGSSGESRRAMFRGRPSKFLGIWVPEKQEGILQPCSKGASIDEVAAYLQITKRTLTNWFKAKEEFADFMAIGIQLAKA